MSREKLRHNNNTDTLNQILFYVEKALYSQKGVLSSIIPCKNTILERKKKIL